MVVFAVCVFMGDVFTRSQPQCLLLQHRVKQTDIQLFHRRGWAGERSCKKMSAKSGQGAIAESRKCVARFWKFFPHLLLCLSLVIYAALGALLFQYIEGGSISTTQQEYHEFLSEIVSTIQNLTGKSIIISNYFCQCFDTV